MTLFSQLVPNSSFVTADSIQTLTNKTLNSPTLTGTTSFTGTYHNSYLTQYGSMFIEGTSTNNIVQVSSTGVSTGGGLWSTGVGNTLFSNAGLYFKVGTTLRDRDTPTGGTIALSIENNTNAIFAGTVTANSILLTGNTGTVTSVSGTGTVNGLTLTGTVTNSGSLTLGGTLSNVSLTSQVTDTLPVTSGGTGVTTSTGTGSVVLSTSPSLTTPSLGVASATSIALPNSITLTNPTAETFLINAAGAAGVMRFRVAGDDRLTITSSGNIGINTSTPAGKLAVVTPSSAAASISDWSSYSVFGPNAGSAAGAGLGLGYNTSLQNSEIVSISPGVNWRGLSLLAAGIQFNAINGSEAMRIDTSGNVGIGTASPGYKLDVSATGNISGQFKTSGSINALFLADAGTTAETLYVGTVGNDFRVVTGSNERMRIDSAGNVGIGTTSVTTSRVQIKGINNTTNAFGDGLKVTSANETVSTQYSWAGINANDTLLFATGGTERMRIASSGIVTATTAFNAPVFNDSNDSSYYTNPFGTSNLLGLTVANTITGSVSGSAGSLSNTTNYFINRGDIAAVSIDTATGLGVWKQLNGGDSHTIIAAGAGGSTNTVQQRFHYTGSMEFRNNTDGSTWQPWKTVLTNTNYNTYSPSLTGSGASGTWGINVTGSSGSTTGSAATSGSAGALSANTGAVSSGLQVWNEISNTTLNPSNEWHYGLRMGHGDAATYYSATLAIPFFSDGLYMRRKTGGTDAAWRRFWHNGDASITASTDFSAPIFKDSGNSAYYVDPDSTSSLKGLTLSPGVQGATTGLYINGGDMTASRNGTTGAIYLGTGGSSYIYFDGSSFEFGSSGFVTSSTSMRAPVFYNTPDTAYYVDPNGTSVLNTVKSSAFGARSDISVDNGFGIYFNENMLNNYAIYRGPGAWDWPFPDLRIAFHTGIQLGANASYQGVRFYTDYDMVTQVMSVNNGSDALGVGNVYVNNSLQADSSLRAPIFYDSNNTAYYINPNSTSALYDAIVIGPNPTWSAYLRIGGNGQASDMATVAASNGNLHLDSKNTFQMYLNYSSSGQVYVNNGGGYLESQGSSIRASLFYDTNNTGYYIDPANMSNFWNLTVNQPITGSVAGYSTYLPTRYDSGQKTNPQQYFGPSIGLRVAMTAMPVVWADTLWINGYAGGDVPDMCALHFSRQATPKMWISTQQSTATSYGTFYELPLFGYNSGNASALYAPLYYDTTNTGYYWNFGSSAVSNIDTQITGFAYFLSNRNTTSNSAPLQCYSNDGAQGAIMSFHRSGIYAINMGLDSDNIFRIAGWSASANAFQMDGSGNLTMLGNVTAYSDVRKKKDITTIENALDMVSRMRGVRFRRIDTDQLGVGVIAQEMLEILPEVVQQSIGNDDTMSVAYGNIVGVLIEAIKEQQASINRLEDKLNLLENK